MTSDVNKRVNSEVGPKLALLTLRVDRARASSHGLPEVGDARKRGVGLNQQVDLFPSSLIPFSHNG